VTTVAVRLSLLFKFFRHASREVGRLLSCLVGYIVLMSSYGLSLALGVGVEVCGLGHETVVLLTSPAAAAAAAVDAGMRLVPLLVTATIDGNQCSSLRDAARTTRPLQLASSALPLLLWHTLVFLNVAVSSVFETLPSSVRRKDRCSAVSDPIRRIRSSWPPPLEYWTGRMDRQLAAEWGRVEPDQSRGGKYSQQPPCRRLVHRPPGVVRALCNSIRLPPVCIR